MKRIRVVLIALAIYMIAGSAVSFGAARSVVSEAEVVSGGDLLIVQTLLNAAKTEDGYDFSYIFEHVDTYIQEADYGVINLETSMGGESLGYGGFPCFNTPESLVDAAKTAGFDMFLTASNHSYDLGYDSVGYKLDVLENAGVDYIGTRKNTSGSLHQVVTVNGIKIGMLNYTKENWTSTKDRIVLNRTKTGTEGVYNEIIVDSAGAKLIALYNEKRLGEFYSVLKADIQALKKQGADIIVAYPHWGTEYNIGYDKMEDKIAQKMCDLGVDVIIGGHPHVVEPTKVYTSKVSGKTTICIHSTGNFVSAMGPHQTYKKNAEYTQDGALFGYTVKKYSDGTACVTKAEVLPLYVSRPADGKLVVVPLDPKYNWNRYGIAKYSEKLEGYESYQRTQGLVKAGIRQYNLMPKIIRQPKAQTVKLKKKATFSVNIVGSNAKYQWQYSADGGKTWKTSYGKGAKTRVLSFQALKKFDRRQYRCRVKNGTGTAFSAPAKLTVKK